ncbi:MAG: PD40 domain-containing protein, partial [Caldilineaceae bacterium]|nr:PD40 domain-containing protein [Caldilineaceae bacterium]
MSTRARSTLITVMVALCMLLSTADAAQSDDAPLVRWHPNEDRIAVADGYTVQFYDSNFQYLDQLYLDDPSQTEVAILSMEWSPNGDFLAVARRFSQTGASTLQVWQLEPTQLLAEVDDKTLLAGLPLAWNPDSSQVAVGGALGQGHERTFVFNAQTGNLDFEIAPAPPVNIGHLAWSPVGSQIVVGTRDGLGVWDTASPTPFLTTPMLPRASSEANVAFMPNSSLIAFVPRGESEQIQILDTQTGQFIRALNGHTDDVKSLTWGDAGLLSIGWDNTAHIWSNSGTLVSSINVEGSLGQPSWSPGGTRFVVSTLMHGVVARDSSSGDITAILGSTTTPIADAGPDQTVTDSDNDGSEWVTLGGSGSTDSDGTIVSYAWKIDGVEIASGIGPQVNLAVGTHTIRLTVTDDGGGASSDEVVIVVAPTPGGQIAYYGACMGPNGMGFMSAICGLNVSDGDTFYLTTGDDPALASALRVAHVENTQFWQNTTGGVYVFDANGQGSTSTVVTSSGTYAEPAWSPDESKLAYAYRPSGSNSKYVVRTVNLDGSDVQTLTADSVNSRAPHWSAASGKIVYYSDQDGDNEIWVMNADGSGKVQL